MIARLPSWRKIKSWVLSSHVSTFLKLRSFISFSFISVFIFLCFSPAIAFGNGLAISNSELVDQNTSNDTIDVEFDITTWGNSWRDGENYDAVWVFAKYCTTNCSTTNGTAVWSHATLKTAGTNPSGVARGSGTLLDIIVTNDKKGAFIQRTGQGSGTVTTTDMQLQWDYGNDGVSDSAVIASTTKVRVFGIEMVYVPQGPFYLGDAADGTANGTAYNLEFGGAATSLPGLIAGGEALTFNTTAGTFHYNNAGAPNANDSVDGTIFTLPEIYPLGYSARYVMKYEVTEGQWVGFINTLLLAAQTTRDMTSATGKNADYSAGVTPATNRNTLAWASGGAASTARDDRAMNWISWPDLAAYLDWAALRPMSEPEYEKFTRGPVYPTVAAYSWGTTTIQGCVAGGHSGAGTGSETCVDAGAAPCTAAGACYVTYNNITFSDGLANADNQTGATRAGIYATGSGTRANSGGSYWGIMDMTGNVTETVVGIGCIGASANNFTSRQFAGSHGDGVLTTVSGNEGNATNSDWPGISATVSQGINATTAAAGMGTRGGSWNTTTVALLGVANRTGSCTAVTRLSTSGGRGVRDEVS